MIVLQQSNRSQNVTAQCNGIDVSVSICGVSLARLDVSHATLLVPDSELVDTAGLEASGDLRAEVSGDGVSVFNGHFPLFYFNSEIIQALVLNV